MHNSFSPETIICGMLSEIAIKYIVDNCTEKYYLKHNIIVKLIQREKLFSRFGYTILKEHTVYIFKQMFCSQNSIFRN